MYRSLAVHSLQMSPSGKLRPDAAVAQAKMLLPVEIRDRTISAMEKCRSVEQGTHKYVICDFIYLNILHVFIFLLHN